MATLAHDRLKRLARLMLSEKGFSEDDDEAAFHEIFTAFIDKVKGAGYKVVKIDWDGLEDWL